MAELNKTMVVHELSQAEQIKRLLNMQGTDAGFFTLAVFSFIEAYLRQIVPNQTKETTFKELIDGYKEISRHFEYDSFSQKYFARDKKINSLLWNIVDSQYNTNEVRHKFGNLSEEEAIAAVSLLERFALLESFECTALINQLSHKTELWKGRLSPLETAHELEIANAKIKSLSKEKDDMAIQVEILKKTKAEYEGVIAKEKIAAAEFEKAVEKNKSNAEKIDALRKERHAQSTENRELQKQLAQKIAELSSADEYITQLSRMTSYTRTRYDFEKSLLRLTPEQEAIVRQINFTSDFLIKGAAGTGKSIVLMKTFERLLKNAEPQPHSDGVAKIKLVTFTRSLEKYSEYIASFLEIENSKIKNFVSTADALIMDILKNVFPNTKFIYKKIEEFDAFNNISKNDLPFGEKEFVSELEKFILPNFIGEKEYCVDMVFRGGMKLPLNENARKKVWECTQQFFCALEKNDEQPVAYGIYQLAKKISRAETALPENFLLDYLFIDETQDLTAAKLFVLRHLVQKCVIIAGDSDQAIYQPNFAWKRSGIDISGHTKILHTNFRNTNQIYDVAETFRAKTKDADTSLSPQTFRMGPPVELHTATTAKDSYSQIISTVRLCINQLSYDAENICIIAQRTEHLEKIKSLLKAELSLDAKIISKEEFDFADEGIVRLSTSFSCKGLDFPVVLFYLDNTIHTTGGYDDETSDKVNRNLIYTALTRGFEMLHVFMPDHTDLQCIEDLREILQK